jgi:hypothetical protein
VEVALAAVEDEVLGGLDDDRAKCPTVTRPIRNREAPITEPQLA